MAEKASRAQSVERVGMEEIRLMPALLDTWQYASITGETPLHVARQCSEGKLPAVKCGRAWRINKAQALANLGLA